MINSLKCPKCGEEVEISQALFTEAKEEIQEQADKRVAQLSSEMAKLIEANQNFKRVESERELDMARKLADVENKTRQQESLKIQEKDKVISDLLKQVEEAKKTALQGSQQTQGEVLELELESALRKEFPNDEISEVSKGTRGADVIQIVKDKTGRSMGKIIWESKNAKWNLNWISKLKDDQRNESADISVLLSIDLPIEFQPFTFTQQVYVTGRPSFLALAKLLRIALYDVFKIKAQNVDVTDKKDYLYQYINSNEFSQKVEVLVETFGVMNEEIEKEKRYFNTKWARQEKQIRKALDSTHIFYGDMQGITGTLPELKMLNE